MAEQHVAITDGMRGIEHAACCSEESDGCDPHDEDVDVPSSGRPKEAKKSIRPEI